MLERWARFVIKARVAVLLAWIAVLVAGALASGRLTPLLANSFSVPGTDSQRAQQLLASQFGERPDGTFTVVFETRKRTAALRARLARAAALVPTGQPGTLRASGRIVFGDVRTALDLQHAKRWTDTLRRALRGTPVAYVTGPVLR